MSAFGDLSDLAPPRPPEPPPPAPGRSPPRASGPEEGGVVVYLVTLRGSSPVVHVSTLEPNKVERAMEDARRARRYFTWENGSSWAEDVVDFRPLSQEEVNALGKEGE